MSNFDALSSDMIGDIHERRSTGLIEFYSGDISKSIIFILGNSNEILYFRDRECVFEDTCTSGVNGFGSEENTKKSPLGLHKIGGIIGYGSSENTIIKGRKPTGFLAKKPGFGEKGNGIISRVMTLEGLENSINCNTSSRYIYIHGNSHWWYWEEKDSYNNINLRRSLGCFGMRPKNIIKLCDEIEKERVEKTLVYIFGKL